MLSMSRRGQQGRTRYRAACFAGNRKIAEVAGARSDTTGACLRRILRHLATTLLSAITLSLLGVLALSFFTDKTLIVETPWDSGLPTFVAPRQGGVGVLVSPGPPNLRAKTSVRIKSPFITGGGLPSAATRPNMQVNVSPTTQPAQTKAPPGSAGTPRPSASPSWLDGWSLQWSTVRDWCARRTGTQNVVDKKSTLDVKLPETTLGFAHASELDVAINAHLRPPAPTTSGGQSKSPRPTGLVITGTVTLQDVQLMIIPLYAPLVLLAIAWPLWLFIPRRVRRWRRRRKGRCASCGYDLRGSAGDICPECGALTMMG
jgi:hypothetical protein